MPKTEYIEVIAPSAEKAKAIIGSTDEPVDFGPSRRYPDERVWGFPYIPHKYPVMVGGFRLNIFLAYCASLAFGVISLMEWGSCMANGKPSLAAFYTLAVSAAFYGLAFLLGRTAQKDT